MTEPRPRFLAPAARVGDGLGYVDRPEVAMRDEPECVGPAIVDAQTEMARIHDRRRHAQQVHDLRGIRQGLSMDARIKDAQRRAKLEHVDITREIFLLRKMLDRGNVTNATVRLEAVEARLDKAHLLDEGP